MIIADIIVSWLLPHIWFVINDNFSLLFTENGNLPLIKLSQLLNKRSSLNAIVYLEFAAVLIGEEGIATKTGLKGTTAELEFIRIRKKREQTRDMKKIRSCNRKEFDNFIPYWLKNHSQGDVCCVKALAVSCFLWNLPEVNDENGKDQRKRSNLETFEGLTWPAHQALLQRDQQFSFGSCFRQMI